MTKHMAKRAVVVGAGMGGLASAGALSPHFEEVVVLERDTLTEDGSARVGIPQGRHVHVLLAGGAWALGDLFPSFEQELVRTGAVRVQVDQDMCRESAGRRFPQRDLGIYSYAVSRPRLEECVREQARALDNVTLLDGCRVERLTSRDGGKTVGGVLYAAPNGSEERLESDLVIDASGRARPTLDFLEGNGHAVPDATTIGVDMCYSSGVFEIPDDAPADWKGVFALPSPPEDSRAGLLMPLEGGRWIVSLGGRVGQDPPGDWDGYMDFARGLSSPTLHEAIAGAERVGEVVRYRFTESIRRHYARLPAFPNGILPIADSVCRFNPIYGQGMSVAAQQAHALAALLSERSPEPEPLHHVAGAFFEALEQVIETPWVTSALPDFAYSETRGERPPDLGDRMRRGAALNKLAVSDAEVHKVLFEVRHLLKPQSALDDPWLTERLAATADA